MKPEPVFDQPWHAQVFALTVHLNESGRLDWSDWAARFGATLKKHGVAKELNGGEDYFAAWLETLEGVLAEEGAASPEEALEMRGAWERAYLETPHGEPVQLRS
ncbi:MAG: nitrile hydratase accessory protein [Marinibacterium sp.]|nr:nitrile hydratase accessory protein [Marinibacterium sp.]